MSILAITLPGSTLAHVARPLFGLGIFATLIFVFKPLAIGLLRAALLLKPRQSLDQSKRRNNLRGVLMLNRMANELDRTQPNLATELRLLASRG